MSADFILAVSVIVVVVFTLVVIYFGFSKKEAWKSDVESKLGKLIARSSEENVNWQMLIMEADKLLNYVFKNKRILGETMGERLKNAKVFFDKQLYNQIWKAHKTRNKLAHEMNVNISDKQLLFDFEVFKKAIREMVK